jgi:hypothetical protein
LVGEVAYAAIIVVAQAEIQALSFRSDVLGNTKSGNVIDQEKAGQQ